MPSVDAMTIEAGPFQPSWESLGQFTCPAWFRDAKFGIWAHWGPQSVPMYGDWYARHMYVEGEPQYLHHLRTYGHPSQHGWKDVIPLWKAERFDPEALMDLYVAAGAKYFVAQATHHDNFDNWHSRHHRWNAVEMGPQRDIVGLWRDAARKRGLRFGVTEHLAASFSWFESSKHADAHGPYAGIPYDGNAEACADLYHRNEGCPLLGPEGKWYTDHADFHAEWFRRIKDLVDQHQPDLLYSDGGLPFYDKATGRGAEVGLQLVAHLYNVSARLHGGQNEAVYNQKDHAQEVRALGVLDLERAQENAIRPYPWQTDTCVGGWFYDVRQVYKTPNHVIEMLIDIVSKNGNLLLNFTQRPDGTLDEECLHILKVLAGWIAANGEGIYGTRPWRVAGEGPTVLESQLHTFKEDAGAWSTADMRFTAKEHTVFAFQMKPSPDRQAFIRSLGKQTGAQITGVRMLGVSGAVAYHQYEDGLLLQYPGVAEPTGIPCFAVETR